MIKIVDFNPLHTGKNLAKPSLTPLFHDDGDAQHHQERHQQARYQPHEGGSNSTRRSCSTIQISEPNTWNPRDRQHSLLLPWGVTWWTRRAGGQGRGAWDREVIHGKNLGNLNFSLTIPEICWPGVKVVQLGPVGKKSAKKKLAIYPNSSSIEVLPIPWSWLAQSWLVSCSYWENYCCWPDLVSWERIAW